MVGREGWPALALSPRTAEAQQSCAKVSQGEGGWRGGPQARKAILSVAPASAPQDQGRSPAAGAPPHTCCAQTGWFSDQRLSVIPVCWTLAEPEQDRHLGSERQLPDEGALALAVPAG